MIDVSAPRASLGQSWGLSDPEIVVHDGGMSSATWFISQGGRRWVAKAVAPALREPFIGGLAVAAAVDAAGIPAGAPVPTRDGQPVLVVSERPLALLSRVEGQELIGVSCDDQTLIGETLARVHRSLQGVSVAKAGQFHWVRAEADHLAIRSWVRPAVAAALDAVAAIDPGSLSWGCCMLILPRSTSGGMRAAGVVA